MLNQSLKENIQTSQALGKIGMIIRGAMNKTVADGLRYTTKQTNG